MEQGFTHKVLKVKGMSCTGCETMIEKALKRLHGVSEAEASFSNSTVKITYNPEVLKLDRIIEAIEEQGYTVADIAGNKEDAGVNTEKAKKSETPGQLIGLAGLIIVLYVLMNNMAGLSFMPGISRSMGYGALLAAGLVTSLHCVSMCGGLNLSQCISYRMNGENSSRISMLKPGLLYNGGRVVSYTIIGGIAGALGSGISFGGTARGIVAVISGLLMVIIGLNMLNLFPWLRKLNPRMPKIFAGRIYESRQRLGPLLTGLLNGLMPCGPLQAMQVYALGTGSFVNGALSMLVFGIGTVPLMLGFSTVSSALSRRFADRLMKAGAILVIVLGLVMSNRGLALSGFPVPLLQPGISSNTGQNTAEIENGVQTVVTRLHPGSYEPITVRKGIPVRWIIKARKSDINGCNNEIVIPKFNTGKKLEPGDNVIEFTPTEAGIFTYTCWMGMIRSQIIVVD